MTKKPEVDITNCDQVQIHIPGSVQAFGALVAYNKSGLITRASENVENFVGISATDLIGKPINTVFLEEQLKLIDRASSELTRAPLMMSLSTCKEVNTLWHAGHEEQ